MKKIRYSVMCLLLLGGCIQAQSDSIAKKKSRTYEFGSNVYAMFIHGGDFYSHYKSTVENSGFNGLYFKLYNGKNAMRYSVDFFRSNGNASFFPLRKLHLSAYRASTSFQLSGGYQRMLGTRRFAPYVAADVFGEYYSDREENYGVWYLLASSIAPNYYSYRRGWAGGAYTGLGLRVACGNHITFNLESGLQFFCSREKSYDNRPYNSVGINGRPLTLTMGVLF